MPLLIDRIAKDIALRRWVLPECLHVPTAAVDEAAISNYIGKIERILIGGSPNRALLVRAGTLPTIDPLLPISQVASSEILHRPMQVWVHVEYGGYRRAYKKAFPHENIDGKVLSHALNRRIAGLQGYQYVRIIPVSRRSNSSSAFSEQWGVALHTTPAQVEANKKLGAFIRYADLADIMLMMDMKLGGGVMDAVNEAQKLLRPA